MIWRRFFRKPKARIEPYDVVEHAIFAPFTDERYLVERIEFRNSITMATGDKLEYERDAKTHLTTKVTLVTANGLRYNVPFTRVYPE